MPAEIAQEVVALITGADLRRGAPGGTRTYVLGLAGFLRGRGLRVTIIANGRAEGVPDGCRIESVTREHVPSTIHFQRALRRWTSTKALDGIAVLHFQRPDDLAAVNSPWAIPPAVCTLHGDAATSILRRHGRLAAVTYTRREAAILPGFRMLIPVDERTASVYRERYPDLANRIQVIPIGIQEPSGNNAERSMQTAPEDHILTFLYVGRLSVEKRVDRIISAFAMVNSPRKRLVIAGTGPEEAHLRRLAGSQDVLFLGNVEHETLSSWFQQADALVLASEFEGLPTAALESLAAGCPVAALHGCGLDGILDGGRGVMAASPDELPHAMVEATRIKRSGQRVDLPPEFTWSAVGPRILSMYATMAPGLMQ